MMFVQKINKIFLSCVCFSLFLTNQLQAKNLNIITTIKPLASLVMNITDNTGDKVDVIIDGYQSEHDFSLKPSQVKKIYYADHLFYISPYLETFLNRTLSEVPQNVIVTSISQNKNLKILKNRDFNQKKKSFHLINDSINHKHSDALLDYHIWLSPVNTIIILTDIAKTLSEHNPENKKIYHQNLAKAIKNINTLTKSLHKKLKRFQTIPFITFHDAYQYFDHYFKLKMIGIITIHPNQNLTIQQIRTIKETIKKHRVKCIFKEPQFSDKIIQRIADDKKITIRSLDPLGSTLKLDKNLYFSLLNNITTEIAKCQ